MTRDPVNVCCYSAALEDLCRGVCLEDVFLSRNRPLVVHSSYCRLVVAKDPDVCDIFIFGNAGGDFCSFHDAIELCVEYLCFLSKVVFRLVDYLPSPGGKDSSSGFVV